MPQTSGLSRAGHPSPNADRADPEVLLSDAKALRRDVRLALRQRGIRGPRGAVEAHEPNSIDVGIQALETDGYPRALELLVRFIELSLRYSNSGLRPPSGFESWQVDFPYGHAPPYGPAHRRRGRPARKRSWLQRLPEAYRVVGHRPEGLTRRLRDEGHRVRLDKLRMVLEDVECVREEVRPVVRTLVRRTMRPRKLARRRVGRVSAGEPPILEEGGGRQSKREAAVSSTLFNLDHRTRLREASDVLRAAVVIEVDAQMRVVRRR